MTTEIYLLIDKLNKRYKILGVYKSLEACEKSRTEKSKAQKIDPMFLDIERYKVEE